MKHSFLASFLITVFILLFGASSLSAQQRRPIDSQHPLWFIHVDVWYKADPQKIIDLIPEEIKPYVCLNLSLSCQYDKEQNIYKMPQNAFQTFKSWGTVCQQNGMWFSCQPASGGHTHIQDYDLQTFEYFFKKFPNFLGWNYAEQFWVFDEAGDKSSATQTDRWALFAKLVEMSHEYGGLLTVSFCGNIWSHPLNPIGELKRNADFLTACQKYPENMLFLYKYTTSSCFYNNESVSFGPFISGLTKNYGVRYDNCGRNGGLDTVLGENHGRKYPAAAGIGTVMEQTCVNGGAVWDGPELTWREECFHEVSQTTVDGYKRRVWERFDNMNGVWNDMFLKIIDGTMYIPSREEVVGKQKIVIINNVTSGSDEDMYATWATLYDGIYKQDDPFNMGNGQWMDNCCYFKSTGRYGTIPMVTGLYDDLAKAIPVQLRKSQHNSRWSTITKKQTNFNTQYPEVSTGDLYVNRYRNQLVTYTPYTYLNKKTRAEAVVPLQYNTCETMVLKYDKLSSGIVREFDDHIEFYLNNYRTDTTTVRTDSIIITGCTAEPELTFTVHPYTKGAKPTAFQKYGAESGTDTIVVKHCGAVDLSIRCSGSADRSAMTDAIAIAPLPQPQQPELYRGPVLIEAEDMDFKNIKSCCTDPYGQYPSVRGHAGNGFMDMGTTNSGALRHQLKLKEGQEGDYVISVRYTCTNKAGNIRLTVNGKSQTARCEKTARNEWKWVSVNTSLNAGTNNFVIINAGSLPMYIDQICYRPADAAPLTYFVDIKEAEGGTITADKSEAAEGDTVTLNVSAEYGYALTELRVVNSVFYTTEKTIELPESSIINYPLSISFVMPNDNVTIEPVFQDLSTVLELDFSTTLSGAIPEGWRCMQENSELHEYPNTYELGARTMSGFIGYQGKALYWREEYAEYGNQSDYPLTLEPGDYKLTFAMAAWKSNPKYKVSILDAQTGSSIAQSDAYTAAPNANGNSSANLSTAVERELEFNVSKAGNYILRFTNESRTSGYDEYLLLSCKLRLVADATGIDTIHNSEFIIHNEGEAIYNLAGQKMVNGKLSNGKLPRGIIIVRTAKGETKKVATW